MGNYSALEMPVLYEIATTEKSNTGPIRAAAQLWAAVPEVLNASHSALSGATNTLGDSWPDNTFEVAFKAPVDEGLASIRNSEQIVGGARPFQGLTDLAAQIDATEAKVAQLYEEWIQLQLMLMALQAAATVTPAAAAMIARIMERMEQLRLQAVAEVEKEATAYATAAQTVQAAGEGHSYKGPMAGSPPSPSADSDALAAGRPFQTVTSFVPDGGQPGTTQTEQLRQAQLDAARAAAGAGAPWGAGAGTVPGTGTGSGDAGLAGGIATAPPPATSIPVASTPTPAPSAPVGAPVAGVPVTGGVPLARTGIGGIPVSSAASTQIPRAAKVNGGIMSASVGKAPMLSAEPTGAGVGGTGRGSSFGPMGGAVPPILGPMATGRLHGLIGRLKPIVTQHGTGDPHRVAGVPNALRGRSTRTDDAFVASGPRANRSRKEQDDSPETLQLLDEEIWQVEQTGKARTTAG